MAPEPMLAGPFTKLMEIDMPILCTPLVRALGLLAVLFCGMPAPAAAATAADSGEALPPPTIAAALRTPRASMTSFLQAMQQVRKGRDGALEKAVATLDLSAINPLVRTEKGAELAWLLDEVIERSGVPDLARFPTRNEGQPFVFNTIAETELSLEFNERYGWRFSAASLAELPRVLDDLDRGAERSADAQERAYLPLHMRLRAAIPANLKRRGLVLEHWQWIGIGIIILAGIVVDKLFSTVLRLGARSWRRRYAEGAFRDLDDGILRPFGLMAMAMLWWAGLNLLALPAGVLVVLLVSVKFLACLSAVWGAYRLVDLLAAFLTDKTAATASKLDDALLPLVTKSVKVFVTVMGIVFIADNLDVDVTSVLAGLGLGGLAFALAAKDVAGNLFGSITVLLDQTFHVGDWVVIGDVEGTVERIGFRSTRVRTFYNSLVSVPNSTLITANVDNMGARSFRRLSCKFGIAYDTPPDRIEAYCEGVRELVRQHPYMRKDNYHVYLNGLGSSSLEILVYVFWQTPDWATELRERHRFLLDCLRLAEQLGVEYAFPTQTLYMKRAEQTPSSPAEEDFAPLQGAREARDHGRTQAAAIVAATLGSGVVPPPVALSGAGDEGE